MPRHEERQTNKIDGRAFLAGVGRWGPLVLIFLPVVLSVAYVHEFGVNVIYRDQWTAVKLFGDLSSGELSFSDLWAPHNEHRFLFPYIAMLSLGALTEWNNVAEMYLVQACLFVTLIVLLLAFKIGVGARLIFFVPIAFLVFSLNQVQNMLWGYQISFAFAQMFSVLALFLLYVAGRDNLKKVALPASLASGVIATFSAGQGLSVWPAGLLGLLVAPLEKRAKRLLVAVWTLAGVGAWIVYFLGYDRDVSSSLPQLLARPVTGLAFFLTLLGRTLAPHPGLVLVSGVLLAGLIVASLFLIYRERKLGEHSFWLSLLAFSMFTALSVTLGRSDMGAGAAAASKYTTFTLLAVISVYAILVKLWGDGGSRVVTALFGAAAAVILLNVPASYWNGIYRGAQIETSRERAAQVLSTYETQSDKSLKTLHKRPETVERNATVLEDLGYNVFSEP